jgi:hypothetical protein
MLSGAGDGLLALFEAARFVAFGAVARPLFNGTLPDVFDVAEAAFMISTGAGVRVAGFFAIRFF